jgi:alpha-glucosidase (family GH31 glycosyl hydrolase)
MQSSRTFSFLSSPDSPYPDRRLFLLSRNTFASSGRFVSHIMPNYLRDWEYLKLSIAGIMNMNMFGITQAGADVCGYYGQTREDELCARWI